MSAVFFKVIFKGNESEEYFHSDLMTLSFKNLLDSTMIKIPSHYLSSLKTLTEKCENIISIQNLEEVIIIADFSEKLTINYYVAALFLMENKEEKKAFLIANIKKIGDVLVGIWPFFENIDYINEDSINKKFRD